MSRLLDLGQLRLRWLLWLAALVLLAVVVHSVPLEGVAAVFGDLGLRAVLALTAANGLVLAALAGRWWLLLRAWGYAVPFAVLVGYRLAAFGVSYFTPGPQFGGEPLQVYLLKRHHRVPGATAVASVALDKLLELLLNFLVLAGGVLLIGQQQLFPAPVQGLATLVAVGLLALPVGGLLLTAGGGAPLSRLLLRLGQWAKLLADWRKYPTLVAATRAGEQQLAAFYRQQPLALGLALLVSLAGWVALIGEYWLMLWLLGASLSPVQTLVALTAARLAILLPLPGGLGVLEGSQVLALSLLGFDPVIGLSAGLLIRLRDVLLGGLGLWWGGLRS